MPGVSTPESDFTFQPITTDNLRATLHEHNVPTDAWGTGRAKTLKHLLGELMSGEARLESDGTGRLRRILELVGVDVFYQAPDGTLHRLKEDRQVFTDGRIRRRDTLPTSLSEKMHPGENPEKAVSRALEEELRIKAQAGVHAAGLRVEDQSSESFPGLQTTYHIRDFVALLPTTAYVPDGYFEVQPDKTTYFVWEQWPPRAPEVS
jgi:hypothetical protein